MNYYDSIKWIFSRLPMFKKTSFNYFKPKPILFRIQYLCSYLGNPQNYFKSIHVAGTNGKGSTCHMLSSILQESGYKVGLFTSPHLKDFRERIRFNGKLIEKDFITQFINLNKFFLEKGNFLFFEINTALAFEYFKSKNVDIAIVEVGLGGRKDSTNIILPIISIITNISFDHMKCLGKSLEEIAYEKAGIIKYNTPVVIGQYLNKTKSVFKKIAKEKNAKIYFSEKKKKLYNIPLHGDYQIFNQSTVLTSVDILVSMGIRISNKNLKKGLENVIINTPLQGRWQILQFSPKIICDIAHNEDSIRIVFKQLKKITYNSLHLVLGFVKEKDIIKILSLLPKEAFYYFCQPSIERKFTIDNLKKLTKGYKNSFYFYTVNQAFYMAKKKAKKEDVIFIFGSAFVVSEII